MSLDLLQAFEILAEFRIEGARDDLRVLSVNDVLLPVQEPIRDLVLTWVGQNRDNSVYFLLTQFSRTFVQIDISLFANDISESSTHTLEDESK